LLLLERVNLILKFGDIIFQLPVLVGQVIRPLPGPVQLIQVLLLLVNLGHDLSLQVLGIIIQSSPQVFSIGDLPIQPDDLQLSLLGLVIDIHVLRSYLGNLDVDIGNVVLY